MNLSALQIERLKYIPKIPTILSGGLDNIEIVRGDNTTSVADSDDIAKIFEKTYGQPKVSLVAGAGTEFSKQKNVAVILSGGQAPGGHNVIAGIFDALKAADANNRLLGILGGPGGIVDGKYIELTNEIIDAYRNTGGFDIIGSGRTKLETSAQFEKTLEFCRRENINAIVIIGGDDSNTNAALLAEWFAKKDAGIQVIGCPKTIDGDLKNEDIETSFGFDTACKTFAEMVGNIERDANSAKKYWHFIKLMGRSASHVALEVGLQTAANITLISEEVEAKKMSLDQIVQYVADIIAARADNGKNFGIALIPEGIIEFIPEVGAMISNLNDVLASNENADAKTVAAALLPENAKVFNSLPSLIKSQLLMDRDPHGNVQVSKIETEKLIIEMVRSKLKEMKKDGKYNGKFADQAHFLGYEGRCAFPSNFDADYCYALGYNAFVLIAAGLTGYLSSVKNLTLPAEQWAVGAVPLTSMMNMERRHGEMKPVIQKAIVKLDSPAFLELAKKRDEWAMNDEYLFPGAIQYFGPACVCDITTKTLCMELR